MEQLLESEKPIYVEFFDGEPFTIDTLEKLLEPELIWVQEDVLEELLYFFNEFSKAGFLRLLADGYINDSDVQDAAVLVCFLLSIPYEKLWENEFMKQDVAEALIQEIESDD